MSLLWPTAAHACMRERRWASCRGETGHARSDGAGGDNQIFVFRKVELVDHSAKQIDIDLSPGGNKAGADFYDDAHKLSGSAGANSPFIRRFSDQARYTGRGTIHLSCR